MQALMTDQQLADRFEAVELPLGRTTRRSNNCCVVSVLSFHCRKSSNLVETKLAAEAGPFLSEGVLVRICRLLESAAIAAIQTGQNVSSPSPQSFSGA
jgi:hypothetical protein